MVDYTLKNLSEEDVLILNTFIEQSGVDELISVLNGFI